MRKKNKPALINEWVKEELDERIKAVDGENR